MSNLDRALRKSNYYHDMCREWGGCYTPSEIVALVDAGAKPTQPYQVEWAKQKMANGESRPTWFYFWPNAALTAMLAEKVQHRKVGTKDKR